MCYLRDAWLYVEITAVTYLRETCCSVKIYAQMKVVCSFCSSDFFFTISIWRVFQEVCMIIFYCYQSVSNAWNILQITYSALLSQMPIWTTIFRKMFQKLCFRGIPCRFRINHEVEGVIIRKIQETAATFCYSRLNPYFCAVQRTSWCEVSGPGQFLPGSTRAIVAVAYNTWCSCYNNPNLYV